MKLSLIVLILLLAVGKLNASISSEDFAKGQWPKMFSRHIEFDLSHTCPHPRQIFYEVKGLGKFIINSPIIHGKVVVVDYFPPTYQKNIQWKAVCGDTSLVLKTIRYRHPAPFLNHKSVEVNGVGTAPFFMTNEIASDAKGQKFFFPLAVNKWGETVWALRPSSAWQDRAAASFMMQEVSSGEWAFLWRLRSTSFLHVTTTGEVIQAINFHDQKIPPNSHGFIFDPKNQELLYLGFDCRSTLPQSINLLPRYLGSTLLKLNLLTHQVASLWSTFTVFDPHISKSLYIGPDGKIDRFQDTSDTNKIKAMLDLPPEWYSWTERPCDIDWSHENSIDYHPARGFLISIRNLNKLVIWNPVTGKNLVIGSPPKCDLCLPEDESFSMQHSAIFVDEDHILLFDNNSPYRGFVGSRLNSRVMLLQLYGGSQLNTVKVKSVINLSGGQSLIRGSISILPNGHWLAYQPGGDLSPLNYSEIDPTTGSEVYRLTLSDPDRIRGIESRPFFNLGRESFLDSNQTQRPNRSLVEPTLEYSY